jgi:pimeloyl-ACP methyl ester carboxylesterase
MQLIHHFTKVNGIRLHYVEAGSGPAVVLLHGFPETHRSWDLQMGALVAAGLRVIAPDLRGYGESARPSGGYDLDSLVRDVAGLCRQVSSVPVRVVGHDWGGAITWLLAGQHPELVERAVVIACAHPVLMQIALASNPRQLAKSWYMIFFQVPVVPELWLSRRGAANLGRMFRETPGAERAPAELIATARGAVGRVASLRAPLAYYRTAIRAGLRHLFVPPELPRVERPVTLIWAEDDACFVPELAAEHHRIAPQLALHLLRNTGHFAHQEDPAQVNALLIDALGAAVAAAPHGC